jgi:hypothetical protein
MFLYFLQSYHFAISPFFVFPENVTQLVFTGIGVGGGASSSQKQ